ncbi:MULTISPECIES: flagellar assembly protein FlgT [Vibrio]|uniref:Flagellar basal-body protein n=4 Tax=Vibrio harveyi group TaxID=717610 RepID=A0A0P7FF54_VIBAL|nr:MULTISPECIES: flagellar assembly protein FlgT [Vibrio]EGR1224997.1 flagellar basal-body protein [Vibrio parahaemolyticus]MDW2260106.1 flagellar assembly protein FlgT [Vibrio sp. 1409]MDW2295242.1 flagellar assembly protein FlgT [Vibrio sp. 1404]NAW93841.1 flagellar basal-body protein [Vibrio sp. V42_P2S4T144]QCO85285.1 flagellar basal-body protein [Vibrio neocaledonicus]GAK18550.1 flagellar protein FlgT [Vibrio sp. JCM 19053]
MKKILNSLFSITLVMLVPFKVMASWYEVTGVATIVSSEETARLHALEDALFKAVNFSGADIGSISNLMPLLEESRNEYQFTNHEVRYILVESERKRRGKVEVKIRVDIYPSATGCHTDQYKKTMLVGNIEVASPQQAVMGQIYQVGDDFSHVVNRQLDQTSRSFVSVGTTDYSISSNYPARTQMIAQDNGAQYIIGGVITDLTATVESQLLQDDIINRQFALEMKVFDGKTGHEIFNKAYREVARWPFAKTSQVDTRSARFWASTYGEMMLRVSRNIMLDLESELSCKITLPEVVAVFGNTVTMDLGRMHGVKEGDKLQLWHTASFIDQNGLPRNKVSQSEITLTVSRIYEHEAELTIDQPNLASSVQIGDVMNKIL